MAKRTPKKKKCNTIWVVLIIAAIAFFMFNKADSSEETPEEENKSYIVNPKHLDMTIDPSEDQENMGWFRYSSPDGDGGCMSFVAEPDVCTGSTVPLTLRGVASRKLSVGLGSDMKTWEVIGHTETSTAAKAVFDVAAPSTPGTYLLRGVSYSYDDYEGCITNTQTINVKVCE
jgi:hypothetical protein